ncbi:v-ATPase subunit C [Teladorsagia circumcincta]|uniref:V-type proton ATPase subunit C n=1 Tax=Teladorsagia circumcincta TaxID=45464 RepID=A0A2G9U3S2_TELCI|nr:v-ATPase subunit C [Teladorsagia circumcincta]
MVILLKEKKIYGGSLITKDLADIVKAEDFVLNSEYLQTLMVVVPKLNAKDWLQRYSTFTSMVVPGSTQLITEEGEHALYSVTLFKKVIDEFKNIARENKFVVRDFVYDEESLKAGKSERDKLVAEKQRQYAPLIRWLKINFGEIFAAYIHVKALRVFVESVLRYGLPVNFQAALVEPSKGSQKKLRAELHKLYIHLDGSAAGPIDVGYHLELIDVGGLASVDVIGSERVLSIRILQAEFRFYRQEVD